MTYTEFARAMLIALYQEARAGAGELTFDVVTSKYGLEKNLRWLQTLANEWQDNGYVDVDSYIGSPLKWHVEIAGPGLRYIEGQYGSKDGVGVIIEPVEHYPPDTHHDVESSRWTGLLTGYVLSEENRAALVRHLDAAETSIRTMPLGQEVQSQTRAYIVAAKALAEAPDPQTDLIWEIIQRANNMAGVASLFVSIIGLFISVSH